ncbi:MAG: hypothetical protein PsegKO_02290 [Pseudohongiellaceae bacterium]|jgi:hypothetical protein
MRSLQARILAVPVVAGLLGFSALASAQDFAWAEDYPVGAAAPEIAAQDQNGELRRFEDLVGENGLLFMLNRSFDW